MFTMRNAGTQMFILNIYRNIYKEGYIFDFMLRCKSEINDEKLLEEVKGYGSKIIETAPFPRNFFQNWREVDNYLSKHAKEYDAIHIHMNSMLYVAPLLLAKKYGIPIRIVHSHNSKAEKKIYTVLHHINRTLFLKLATARLACSNLAGRWMYSGNILGGGSNRYLLVQNGIELEKFNFDKETRNAVRREWGVDDDTVVVGNAGRFAKVKNHSLMIDIFCEYVKEQPNAVLVLAGIGETMEEVKNKVLEKDIEKKVIFLGVRTDVHRLCQGFDIFLIPSFHEGGPITLIEAQASKLPCVISSTITTSYIVNPNVFQVDLSAPVSEWVKYMNRAIEETVRDGDQSDMRAAGFDVQKTIKEIKKVYGD
jgi:glycosyltransferase involved in cell wall biosynthesis